MNRQQLNVVLSGEIFISQRYGGISRYFVELGLALKRLRLANVKIEADFYINEHLRKSGLELAHKGIFFKKYFRGLTQLAIASALARRNFSHKFDLVHSSYYRHESFWGCNSARVTTFYDMIHERFSQNPSFFARKKQAYRASDLCIAISHATKNDMVEYLGADPDRISVVHLASNLCALASDVHLPKSIRREFLMWVGPRSWYKNFDRFASAFARSKACEQGIQIVCFGGPDFDSTERHKLHEFGLKEDQLLHFTPDDAMLKTAYTRAMALVYVSKFEGFGIPPLEAMQCGCPVIASNCGSLPEVVGDAAISVSPDDSSEISQAIDEVVFNSSCRSDLVSRGLAQAAKFSWEKCAIETHNAYRRAIEVRH